MSADQTGGGLVDFELKATTAAGRRMVELAEEHSVDFATRAAEHDRENSFVAENFDLMKKSGFLAAAAPEEFGGLGVDSVHDVTIAISRLARGCASSAITANMHIGAVWVVTRTWQQGRLAGDSAVEEGLGRFLPILGASQVIVSGAGTESGSAAFAFPQTTATPVDGGYVINGHKIFATNSDIADSVTVFLKVPDGEGWYRGGIAIVLRGSPGMDVRGNWDALGMRGSGSHDVVFTDCFVPKEMVTVNQPVGTFGAEGWPSLAATNYALIGAFLGIAEAARTYIVDMAKTRRKKPFDLLMADQPATQFQIAEIDVGLAAARATLGRTALLMDEYFARPDSELTMDDVHFLMHEWQCTKLIVNRAATDIVDRAMALSGGAGYLASSPLSRLYRDVRAGPFMQPLSPNEAFEFIGQVALGIDPMEADRQRLEKLRETLQPANSTQ
jgi:alkylation response protein AidB-like acyl-CoA dehydrogenase